MFELGQTISTGVEKKKKQERERNLKMHCPQASPSCVNTFKEIDGPKKLEKCID